MKIILSIFLLCALLIPTTALSMPTDEFVGKAQQHYKGELSFADFIALCELELAGDAQGNTSYQSEIYANRALAYFKQGDFDNARADNVKALEINPKSARAAFNHGMLLHHDGKFTEAYAYMMDAASRAEKHPKIQAAFQRKAAEYRDAAAITPTALWKAFDDNEVAAEDAYKGKLVILRGTISAITTDMAGYPVISFDVDQTGLVKVNCVFAKEDRPVIGKLQKGQTVLIPGTCDGMILGQVFIKKCQVN